MNISFSFCLFVVIDVRCASLTLVLYSSMDSHFGFDSLNWFLFCFSVLFHPSATIKYRNSLLCRTSISAIHTNAHAIGYQLASLVSRLKLLEMSFIALPHIHRAWADSPSARKLSFVTHLALCRPCARFKREYLCLKKGSSSWITVKYIYACKII